MELGPAARTEALRDAALGGVVAASIDELPAFIWLADANGAPLHVNESFLRFTGVTEEALGSDEWVRIFHADDVSSVAREFRAASAGATSISFRARFRRGSGAYVWFLTRGTRVSDDPAIPSEWLCASIDIDDLSLTHELLASSEERYREIIETSQEGVIVVDAAGGIRYVNARMAELLEADPDALFARPWLDFCHPSQHALAQLQIENARHGEHARTELRLRRSDGSDLWVIAAVSALVGDNGTFNGTLAMITDITARKHMEMRLAAIAADYRSLAEASPLIVWTSGPDGALDYTNERWTEYTGIPRGDSEGWGWIPAIHTDDINDYLAAWRAAIDSGDDFEATYRLRRAADHQYRWHTSRARALRDESGAILRWFGTAVDIHDERRTARQLEIIARTSTMLGESLDRDALLDSLAQIITFDLARGVAIALYSDDGKTLTLAATNHRDPDTAIQLRQLRGQPCFVPEGAMAAAQRIRGAAISPGPEPFADFVRPDYQAQLGPIAQGSFVCVPMRARGRLTGFIFAFAAPSAAFSDDEAVIFTEIAARAAVAVDNAELYAREHRVAATLQQELLPSRLPDIAGMTFDAIYEPGATEAQIGGDWYDAVELPDGRVLVSIGDVTGRGLRAAVIMGRVRQAIEALATYQSDPAQLLNAADAVLRRAHPDAIVTALVGVIDRARNTFAYATAGHPTPIIRAHDGSIVLVPGYGLPLGLRDHQQPPTSTIVLPSNATILLYTDGLTESTRDIEVGERRVFAALADPAIAGAPRPAAAILRSVLFDGSNDDVAVFTIRINDDAPAAEPAASADSVLRSEWSMHWSFDARDYRSARDVRELFIAYLKAKGQGDADYAGAELVFGELIGNVVRHAPGIVDIEIEWRGTSPVLHVLDRGPGYNREAVLPATYSENGRGLFLVTQLTREFTVTRLPGYGSHARAVLPIERSA